MSTLIEEETSEIELKIACIWGEVLGIDKLSLDDDFFAIGGNSLKATKVVLALNKYYGVDLSFEDIFDFPIIRLIAKYIESLMGIQGKLVIIWKEVLKIDSLKPQDDFFELGGHSLMANQVLAKVEKRFNLELNFEDMYNYPTLEAFSKYLDDRLSGEELTTPSEFKPTLKNNQKAVSHISQESSTMEMIGESKTIQGIEPFGEVLFKNCFYNSLFPVVKSYQQDIFPYMANDVIVYKLDPSATDMKLKIDYIEQKSLEALIREQGISFKGKSISNNIIDDIKTAISNGRPVIIWIDCYYLSIRTDTYLKNHLPHTLLIYGYNEQEQFCQIIEHEHHESLNYLKKKMSFNDIIAGYTGYVNNFQSTELVIINAKQLEKYISTNLLDNHEESQKLINFTILTWNGIRSIIAKYWFSSIYKGSSFQSLPEKISEIYKAEYEYYKSLLS